MVCVGDVDDVIDQLEVMEARDHATKAKNLNARDL